MPVLKLIPMVNTCCVKHSSTAVKRCCLREAALGMWVWQDMIVSILPGGRQGSGWHQPRKPVALAIRLAIFAVEGLTAYAVSSLMHAHVTSQLLV